MLDLSCCLKTFLGMVIFPYNITLFGCSRLSPLYSVFWLGLWINASRYALEGIIFTQFEAISTPVDAIFGSPFWFFLGCGAQNEDVCSGTMIEYATFFFGNIFSASNRGIDIGVLIGWILLALFGTFICLKKFNYTNT